MYSCATWPSAKCAAKKVQRLSSSWYLHRAGRITASISKQAVNVLKRDEGNYPKNFVNTVMQYAKNVDVAATRYGNSMEPHAIKSYIDVAKISHDGLDVSPSGLYIKKGIHFWVHPLMVLSSVIVMGKEYRK